MSAVEIERTITISHPFKTPDGDTVESITVRKPTVGATRRFIEAIQKGEPADLGMLLSQSGKVLKEDDLDDMLEEDLDEVDQVIMDFFPKRVLATMERMRAMLAALPASSQPSSDGPLQTSTSSNGPTPSDGPSQPATSPAAVNGA